MEVTYVQPAMKWPHWLAKHNTIVVYYQESWNTMSIDFQNEARLG